MHHKSLFFIGLNILLYLCNETFLLCSSKNTIKNEAYKEHQLPPINKFILITSLYNEENQERAKEYLTCLEKNLSNPFIDHIHVIYDTSKDTENNTLLDYLQNKNIPIDYISGRPTYGFCFTIANKLYHGKRIILSNADIYFNDTLGLLSDYNLANRLLALTRWEVKEDGALQPYFDMSAKNRITYSQDTWIFNAPIRQMFNEAIQIGSFGCDCKIAWQAHLSGMQVLNPCVTIQCCHIHQSKIRHYQRESPLKKDFMGVPWDNLNPSN